MDTSEVNRDLLVLPAEFDVSNTERICAYLRNLRERLQITIQQHCDLIHSSLNIVREMSDVSTTLSLTQSSTDQQQNKIKRLIMEFENMHTGDSDTSSIEATDLRALLDDFRRLHESHLLRDSLMCFNRAKESFEKVDVLLNQVVQTNDRESPQPSPQSSQIVVSSQSASRSLRDKIQAFNIATAKGQNVLQNFTHCFSTASSTNVPSGDENKFGSSSRTNSGYEGDVDSEIDPVDSLTRQELGVQLNI